MEITGKLISVLPLESGTSKSGKDWKKQGFILETPGQYPKQICLQAWGDRVDDVEKLTTGDTLNCFIDIESREYNQKWYTDVKVYKIDVTERSTSAEKPQVEDIQDAQVPEPDDNLPF
jgi:hypothetical protein